MKMIMASTYYMTIRERKQEVERLMAECYLFRWHISDYGGRRDGDYFLLNEMKLYKCKRLSEWIRVNGWMLRFRDVIWFLGGEWREFGFSREDYTIAEVGLRLKELLGDKNLFEVARQAENYASKLPNRMRWFYANLYHIKKEEVDKKSDRELTKYFSDRERSIYARLSDVRNDIECPFCKENGFDLIGLKSHIQNGDCEKYNTVEDIVRVF